MRTTHQIYHKAVKLHIMRCLLGMHIAQPHLKNWVRPFIETVAQSVNVIQSKTGSQTMTKRPQRNEPAVFKAKIAIEAIKGVQSTHPTLVAVEDYPRIYQEFMEWFADETACRHCGSEISVTAGTIFDRTQIPLKIWFAAMWFVISQ